MAESSTMEVKSFQDAILAEARFAFYAPVWKREAKDVAFAKWTPMSPLHNRGDAVYLSLMDVEDDEELDHIEFSLDCLAFWCGAKQFGRAMRKGRWYVFYKWDITLFCNTDMKGVSWATFCHKKDDPENREIYREYCIGKP